MTTKNWRTFLLGRRCIGIHTIAGSFCRFVESILRCLLAEDIRHLCLHQRSLMAGLDQKRHTDDIPGAVRCSHYFENIVATRRLERSDHLTELCLRCFGAHSFREYAGIEPAHITTFAGGMEIGRMLLREFCEVRACFDLRNELVRNGFRTIALLLARATLHWWETNFDMANAIERYRRIHDR